MGTRPSKQPSTEAEVRTSTPAPRACSASSRARSWPPSASARPPGSGPSSASTTSAPASAAAIAARSPARPPPTTSTSAWRRRYSVRHSRSSWEARSLPEAGGVAQHLLVQRPQPPRADEGLVVEARRREGAADRVGDGHDVVLEAGGGVEVLDRHALAHRLGAGAHAGRAVDGDEAVRALPGAAQQAAAAVVLEAARERALARGEERGGDGVAGERLDALAVEGEADRPRSGRCARRAARAAGSWRRRRLARAAPSSARRWCACRARR